MTMSQLRQIDRWFQAAKDAVKRHEPDMAWSWANQGQIYVHGLIRDEEQRIERSGSELPSDGEGS